MNRKIAMFTQKSLRDNILDYLTVQTVQQQSDTITLPITKTACGLSWCTKTFIIP